MSDIIHGDACKVLNSLDAESFDLVLTSPPYDGLRDYGNETFLSTNDLFLQIYKVLKTGGMLVWVVNDQYKNGGRSLTSFKHAINMKATGFSIHDVMIYEKHNFSNPSSNRYHQIYEFMICASKGKPKTFNPIKDKKNVYAGSKVWGKNTVKQIDGSKTERKAKVYAEYGMRTNIWRIRTNTRDADGRLATKHPAPFPLSLAMDHILTWTNEGDRILDPLCGSGTTLVAAKKLNRAYLGIEENVKWIKLATERLNLIQNV